MQVETPETSVFFAWRGYTGKIGKQRGFKDPKAVWYGKKDADYISVAKFSKGGAGKYRTLENLVSIDKVYSDIDSKYPLDWQELIEKCNRLGIPKPNLIIRTPTQNHYQVMWNIPAIDKSLLDLWTLVQEGINKLFEEFGADSQALDAIRYLRNPNKCEKAYYNELCVTSLTVLYRSLKMAGYIKDKPKPKWPTKFSPNGRPIKESRQRLEQFLKDNPEHESTYVEMSKTLSIPERTVRYLTRQFKRDGSLETQVKGKGKNRRTLFIFKRHIKESLNTLLSNGVGIRGNGGDSSPDTSLGKEKKESDCSFPWALGRAKAIGLPGGVRNSGFWGLAQWLSVSKKMSYDEIVRELFPVLILTPNFSRREFEKTIRSACRDRYRYCISAKKFEKVFLSLGVLDSH